MAVMVASCSNPEAKNQEVEYNNDGTVVTLGSELYGEENEHEWVDLGLRKDGHKVLFATANIGASNPYDFGSYFQWGATEPGTVFRWNVTPFCDGDGYRGPWSKYSIEDKIYVLESSDDAASVLWGGDWRMPGKEEFDMLFSDNIVREWVSRNGSSGWKFKGKDAFSDAEVYFPAAGFYNEENTFFIDFDGSPVGCYWSRDFYLWESDDLPGLNLNAVNSDACFLWFDNEYLASDGNSPRSNGNSIRPVRTEPE